MALRDFFDNLAIDGGEYSDFMSHPYPKDLVVSGREGDIDRWRCLKCLNGGIASGDAIELAVAVHLPTCSGDEDIAKMRFELLDMISGVSESWYAAGWLSGIEKILLKRGGLWLMLAEQVGFPTDWRGLNGWSADARTALQHHGIESETVLVWPASLGARG